MNNLYLTTVDARNPRKPTIRSAERVRIDYSQDRRMKPVKRWMRSNSADFYDYNTEEWNCTLMSEAAADEFNLYEDQELIPEWVYELALHIGETQKV